MGGGPYVYKMCGTVHHRTGSLMPLDDESPLLSCTLLILKMSWTFLPQGFLLFLISLQVSHSSLLIAAFGTGIVLVHRIQSSFFHRRV